MTLSIYPIYFSTYLGFEKWGLFITEVMENGLFTPMRSGPKTSRSEVLVYKTDTLDEQVFSKRV